MIRVNEIMVTAQEVPLLDVTLSRNKMNTGKYFEILEKLYPLEIHSSF